MKFSPLAWSLLAICFHFYSPEARADDPKPLVFMKCPFRNENILTCESLKTFIRESLTGIDLTTLESIAPYSITLTDLEVSGGKVEYTIAITGPNNTKFNLGFQLAQSLDAQTRKEKLLVPIKAMLELALAAPLDADESTSAWYFDFNASGMMRNSKTNSSIDAGGSSTSIASYDRYKINVYLYGKYAQSSTLIGDSMQSIEGNKFGTASALTYSLSENKHWNVGAILGLEHNPAEANKNLGGGIGGFLEWDQVPIRDHNQATQISIRAGLGLNHNEYQYLTSLKRKQQTYAGANAEVSFVYYSRNSKLKTEGFASASAPFIDHSKQFSRYSVGASVGYQIKSSKPSMRVDAFFHVNYRERSMTDPDASVPLNDLYYYLYQGSAGFSTFENITFTINFGNTKRKNQDQRGPNFN